MPTTIDVNVSDLLNQLGSAVAAAKAKKESVDSLKANLAKYVADKQAAIDAAQTEYDDAHVAMSRLQEQVRASLGDLLPAPDPRYRASK